MIKKIITYFKKNSLDYEDYESCKEEILIYFAGNKKQIYQINQWVNFFKEFNSRNRIGFIIRNRRVFECLMENQDYKEFNIYYIPSLKKLINFYKNSNIKQIFYVNNSFKNFHSLIDNKAVHIHINHGESEKISTFSNQVKAYDYIYIVGDAAYNKYMLNLVNINPEKFIKVGRPQIEYITSVGIETYGRKVVLYAPTWEGGFEDMNYSSIIKYGSAIVDQLIEKDYFIIYKPHPFVGSRDKKYKRANEKIIARLNAYKYAKVYLDENILNIYPKVDVAIFDNSATIIDFLIFDKPFLMTEMFSDDQKRGIIPVIKYAGEIINDSNSGKVGELIKNNLENDGYKGIRNKIKKYYLGEFDYFNKESTETFIKKSLELISIQEKLLKRLDGFQHEFNNSIMKKIKDEY